METNIHKPNSRIRQTMLLVLIVVLITTILCGCTIESDEEHKESQEKAYQEGYTEGYDDGYDAMSEDYQNLVEIADDNKYSWSYLLGPYTLDTSEKVVHDTLGECVWSIERKNLFFVEIDYYDDLIDEINDDDGYLDEYTLCEKCFDADSTTNDNDDGEYIGNLSTKKFHYSWCSSVGKMSEKNKVELTSRDEAINGGYEPCKICEP